MIGQLLCTGLYMLALAAIIGVAAFFIFCRRYEEGIIGNLALGFLALSCALLINDVLNGNPPPPVLKLFVGCAALFLLRHAYRFAMFHWHGFFGWGRPRDIDSRIMGQ